MSAKSKAKSDGKSEDFDLEDIVKLTFASMDHAIEELNVIPVRAKEKTELLLKLFDDDIFKSPSVFLKCITDLSEEIGHANHVVLEIDLRRQGIIHADDSKSQPVSSMLPEKVAQAAQTIIQTQPQKSGGFWDFMGTSKMAGVMKQYFQSQKDQVPQITTSREVTDVLDYGRQLIAESNRTHKYYEQSLAHLQFFDDEETKKRFTSQLREHMNKISGIVRAFCRTAVEYRKELAGQRKSEMAQSVIALKLAEYQSLGGMRTSELYKMVRDAAGQENAGRN